MVAELFTNTGISNLSGSLDATQSSGLFRDITGFSGCISGVTQMRAIIDKEIVIIGETSGNNYVYFQTRGAEGTTATPHADYAFVRFILTKGAMANLGSGVIASGSIGPSQLSSGAVGSGIIASGTIQGYFGSTRHIASGTVGVFDLGSGAVIAGTVGSGAAQSGNIASGVIGVYHLQSGLVTSGLYLSGSIGSGQIGVYHLQSGLQISGLIQSGGIGSGAVKGSLGGGYLIIGSGTIGPNDIGSGTVLSGAIASGQIGVYHLQSGLTTSGLYLSGSIGSGQLGVYHLQSGLVTSGLYLSGSIGSGQIGVYHLQSGLTTSGLYLSGSIGSGQIGLFHLQSGLQISGLVLSGGIGSGQVGWPHLASGAVRSGDINDAAVVSGSYASGSFGYRALASGGINTSGSVMYGAIASGAVNSGDLQDSSIVSGSVASGQISRFHLASGTGQSGVLVSGSVNSGNISSGQVDWWCLASGVVWAGTNVTITQTNSGIEIASTGGAGVASGTVQSGNIASGAVQGFFGSTRHIASGTVGVFDLGSGAVIAGTVGSGAIQSGNITSGSIDWSHFGEPMPVGICEGRLSMDMSQPVPVSGDIIQMQLSGEIASGSTVMKGIIFPSGVGLNYLAPGMLVVGSGIPGGTFVVSYSGISRNSGTVSSGSLTISQASTHAVSGVLFTFIPQIFLVPYHGDRISIFDANSGTRYYMFGGKNCSTSGSQWSGAIAIKTYDNSQTCQIKSGIAKISGLLDAFQLTRGMEVVFSGIISSGTVITSIDGATHISISAVAISGATAGPSSGLWNVLFANVAGSGFGSGLVWDIFATLRSGTPWLQFSNAWGNSGQSRTDAIGR